MEFGTGLKIVRGKQFADETVSLDGTEFIGCQFDRCILEYGGGNLFLFVESPIRDCQFEFVGPANHTTLTLANMYASGMAEWVEAYFNHIRNPFGDALQ